MPQTKVLKTFNDKAWIPTIGKKKFYLGAFNLEASPVLGSEYLL